MVHVQPAAPESGGFPDPVQDYLTDLHFRISRMGGGSVASYIPELAKADPNLCGMAIATVDGKVYTAGDADVPFTIQSVSKAFVYGYALERYGRETILQRVGVEPTGEAFNSIVLDEKHNRPFNPMVNAGAIAIAETIKGKTLDERVATMLRHFSRLAGRKLDIDQSVFESERATGHRNRAIAYMMLNSGMIRRAPEDILDIYFRQCAISVTCTDLAVMAATLANNGVNPVTGERAIEEEYVPDVLTVMNSCGMYNYAGQWSYDVGIPAKSGVAGSIMGVIPGQVGVAVFSPPIDEHGNSVRGVAACRDIAETFGLNIFKTQITTRTVIRRELRLNVVRSKRVRDPIERKVLDEDGHRVCVLEVQGPLFFGSSERLLRRVGELSGDVEHVILDLRRVPSIDQASRDLFVRLAASFEEAGHSLAFAHLTEDGLLASLYEDLKEELEDLSGRVFDDRDTALEWFENRLIADAGVTYDSTRFSLSALDLFRGMPKEDIRLLEGIARPFQFEAGDLLIREGDAANVFFVIARGSVSVQLASPDGNENGRALRLASIGPGLSFGEMAVIDGGHRSANVVANERVVCYGFSVAALKELGREHPQVINAIYANMTRDLSERLRRMSAEVRALES